LAEAALRGGRYAEAVLLALDLPGGNGLLAEAVLKRCAEWRKNSQPTFAADLIRKVLPRFGADDELRGRLARELVECGGLAEAVELVADARPLVAAAADAAVARGATGRDTLPADLRPGHAAVLAAFAAFEAGDDEAARTHLNSLGLSSPFLEWKVLLRGLMAWQAGDDARALDNWSRLAGERLPARLAAPLRSVLDAEFARGYAADVQAAWRAAADRLVGGRLLTELRKLQALIGKAGDLNPALRQAEVVLPMLREADPGGEAALVATMIAAVVHHGTTADIERWRKFLPSPPDDPTLNRLQALLADASTQPAQAARHWLAYEKVLAERRSIFGNDTDRARALVLARAGDRFGAGDLSALDELAAAFSLPTRRPQNQFANADAFACYDAALRLQPDLLAALSGRVQAAIEAGQDEDALEYGKQLLAVHPHHAGTLREMIGVCQRLKRPVECAMYSDALRAAEPLNIGHGLSATAAHRASARAHAIAGNFEAALADLDAAAEASPAAVQVQRATLAWLAGDASAAEAHLAAANLPPAALAGRVLAEAAALKLPRAVKSRFEPVLKLALDAGGPPEVVLALAEMVGDHAAEGFSYRGQKSCEKKAEARLREWAGALQAEAELERACIAARRAGWHKLASNAALRGEARFRMNPRFPFEVGVAEIQLRRYSADFARHRLEIAGRLLDALPPARRPAGLEREIADAIAEIDELTDVPLIPSLNQLIDLFDRLPRRRR